MSNIKTIIKDMYKNNININIYIKNIYIYIII